MQFKSLAFIILIENMEFMGWRGVAFTAAAWGRISFGSPIT